MAAISQTTFSNTFSWTMIIVFWFEFHWNLFPWNQLTIFLRWFRLWLGAGKETSQYLNRWWPSSPTHPCITRDPWVNVFIFVSVTGPIIDMVKSIFSIVYVPTTGLRTSTWHHWGRTYDIPMIWKWFPHYWPFVMGIQGHCRIPGHRWIPHTKASDAELWCFLWSAPE